MGIIQTLGRAAWRRWVIDSVPASGANSPNKVEIGYFVDAVDSAIVVLQTATAELQNNTTITPVLIKATWAGLATLTGSTGGQRAEVTGTDTGTHTDPVVGGTVANEGIYSWSASPAGWQRVHARDTAQSVRDDVGTNPNGPGAAPTAFASIALIQPLRNDLGTNPNGPGVAPSVFSGITLLNQKTALIQPLQNDDFQISDTFGAAAFRVSGAGVQSKSISTLRAAVLPRLRTDYEYNVLMAYGQSNSIGWNAHPALSTTASPSALMLSGGVGTLASYPYGSQILVPLVEADTVNTGESPLSGSCQMIDALIVAENDLTWANHKFHMVAAAAGEGGQPIASLAKGSTDYTKMMSAVDRMVVLAGAANALIGCQAVPFIQGESDIGTTVKATYKTAFAQLQTDLQTDVQAKTGQSNLVYLLATQVAAHSYYTGGTTPDIAIGQYEVSQANPLIKLVMPLYFIDYSSGDVHFTNISAKWVGAYLGLAYKRVVLEGRDWKPLAPLRKIVQGNVMIVVFDVPRPPLVIDSVQVSDPGNFGFAVVDSGGSARTITSVELAGPDRVKITCSGALASSDKVRYAWSPHSGSLPGRFIGARGCLRDSAGEDLVFDPTGLNLPMHNWCIISEL